MREKEGGTEGGEGEGREDIVTTLPVKVNGESIHTSVHSAE